MDSPGGTAALVGMATGADAKVDEMLAREKKNRADQKERGRGEQGGQSGRMRMRGESSEDIKTCDA